MPKSKRAKVISLTKTKSAGRAGKAVNIERIQKSCDDYATIYLYSCANLRTNRLKELRSEMKDDSQFYMGKNTLAKVAFGHSKETSYLPGLDKLSREMKGDVGLLFTNKNADELEQYFKEYSELDYARAGSIATKTVTRNKGPCPDFPSSMYEPLRKLHLPVILNKGKVEFEEDHNICVEGDTLTPEQAQALKLFEHKLASFQIQLLFRYREGTVTQLVSDDVLAKLEDYQKHKIDKMDGDDDGY
mmetsp:Transcript_13880/g.16106  ORF Transcript_13880/g.16106 Transcript_13880/m.16106 type:complete len:245 (-) Transcript_13880:788-1522(-)